MASFQLGLDTSILLLLAAPSLYSTMGEGDHEPRGPSPVAREPPARGAHGVLLLGDLQRAELAAKKMPSFLRAIPDIKRQLHTTRTTTNFWPLRKNEKIFDAGYNIKVIIGVVDSGIYNKHLSFFDAEEKKSWSHQPRWKGGCTEGGIDPMQPEACDGHRRWQLFPRCDDSPSHGLRHSHGDSSPDTHRHIQSLQLKRVLRLPDSMEEVIHDGVDLINISLGTGANDTDGFDMDLVAIGAFNAMAKGGHAPWIIKVVVTSVDRRFDAEVSFREDSTIVSVVCRHLPSNMESLKRSWALGTVLISDETADYTTVTYNYDGNHSKGPFVGVSFNGVVLGARAPTLASFWSRGPSLHILAPRRNIMYVSTIGLEDND
ncbi:hypothetical protein HU200_011730 [Digitaria exilis]|uniref:Uncharacterized protein n=1 Tax=Digitaria exilis TaxID=1010633 RepID=A0A835KMD9_9POAL|nr:hypothetical protein HU200_011730 [Digitaria exilis]